MRALLGDVSATKELGTETDGAYSGLDDKICQMVLAAQGFKVCAVTKERRRYDGHATGGKAQQMCLAAIPSHKLRIVDESVTA